MAKDPSAPMMKESRISNAKTRKPMRPVVAAGCGALAALGNRYFGCEFHWVFERLGISSFAPSRVRSLGDRPQLAEAIEIYLRRGLKRG